MNKRLHVAYFTNTYYPVVSGVVRSISTFRQALTELGHNVFIFAQDTVGYEDRDPFIFRYPTIDLPLPGQFPMTIPISPFVDKLLPLLKPAVIHSHHPFLLGGTAANKAEELNLPLVFTFHTRYREYSHYVAFSQEFVKEVIDRLLGDYMQRCHHIVVPSEGMRQMVVEEYGITGQITAIPTGIDLEPYHQADGQALRQARGWGQDTVLISVGRLAKEKNWERLLTAAAQVMQQRAGVRLALIGDGDERKTLKELARQLGIAERVEFIGTVPFEDIPHYLTAADLFVFASVTETQGLVTMEAIAAGLPVVAVDTIGTRDVIKDGQQGFLTDDNTEALAQAMDQVLDDEALQRRFRAAARHRAQSFDMLSQAKKLINVYDQATEDKKTNRLVQVDKHKKIFSLILDEEFWTRWLGREPQSRTS